LTASAQQSYVQIPNIDAGCTRHWGKNQNKQPISIVGAWKGNYGNYLIEDQRRREKYVTQCAVMMLARERFLDSWLKKMKTTKDVRKDD
jgi:hypothetical protein